MKRIKLMLTAVTVIALVSGALAFKAKAFANHPLFCENASHVCNVQVDGLTIVNQGTTPVTPCTGHPNPTLFGTASGTGACPDNSTTTPVYDINDSQ